MILREMDQRTMLMCRLINSDWKAVVDSLQEKKILSNWLTWNTTNPFDQDLFQMMPTVQVANRFVSQGDNYVYRDAAITESAFEDGYNPFPFKALCICYRKKKKYLDRTGMHFFLMDHGHHLTSLALHKTRVPPSQLLQILNHLPNLKVLTLIQIILSHYARNFFQENPIVNAPRCLPTCVCKCYVKNRD